MHTLTRIHMLICILYVCAICYADHIPAHMQLQDYKQTYVGSCTYIYVHVYTLTRLQIITKAPKV